MYTLLLGMLLFGNAHAQNQESETDPTDGCPIFEMPDGDTTYIMKQYFLVFYKRGPATGFSEQELAEIQKGHMGFIGQMAEEGNVCLAGPFGDDTDLRGMLIFNVPKKATVESLMQKDPAVKNKRLIFEVHPWWAAKGSKLK